MTGQTGSTPTFSARADAAAVLLKERMKLPGRQVAVGPDGKPPPPPPPEGSYLRMEMERQQAVAAQSGRELQAERTLQVQKPPPSSDEASEGQGSDGEMSGNATRRFSELTGQLRERERALSELQQRDTQREREAASLRAELDALRQEQKRLADERQQLIDQNLDSLDPETRAIVLNRAEMQRMLAEQRRELTAEFRAQFDQLHRRNEEDDYAVLASKFELFDLGVHRPQIEAFRLKNPNSTVEQAYKAVAEPEALVLRAPAHAPSVPPVLAPGPGPTAEHLVPRPAPNRDEAMRADARKAREMMTSADPRDHRDGIRLFEKNIRERLAGRV